MAAQKYTVKAGDTLWGIAQQFLGSGSLWKNLGYSGDPTKLAPGTVLTIPSGSGAATNAGSSGGGSSAPAAPSSGTDTSSSGGLDLSSLMTPPTPTDTSGLEAIASNLATAAQNESTALTNQIAPTQNLYTALADRLSQQEKQQTTVLQQQQQEKLGQTQASEAAAGGVPGTGFNAAVEQSIQTDYNNQINTVAQNYSINSEQLTAQETKDIATLQQEAADALIKGEEDVANITTQIIGIKQQDQNLQREYVSAILNAQLKEEQIQATEAYRQATLSLRAQSIDLSAQRLQLSQNTQQITLLKDIGGLDPNKEYAAIVKNATDTSGNTNWAQVWQGIHNIEGIWSSQRVSANPLWQLYNKRSSG